MAYVLLVNTSLFIVVSLGFKKWLEFIVEATVGYSNSITGRFRIKKITLKFTGYYSILQIVLCDF